MPRRAAELEVLMTSLLTRRQTAPQRRSVPLFEIAVGAIALLLFVLIQPAITTPHVVKRVTIDNSTVYDLDVAVATRSSGPWMALGAVGRHGHTAVEEVIDQGDRWVFRFSAAGVAG